MWHAVPDRQIVQSAWGFENRISFIKLRALDDAAILALARIIGLPISRI
jgi:hypothetical protein